MEEKTGKDEPDNGEITLEEEAKALNITKSKVSTASFKHKKPEELARENKRQAKLADDRLRVRIDAKKIQAKMKPIDKRKELLVARFKAIRAKTRPNSYCDANIKAWTEEYEMIMSNPKMWNNLTKKGTISFIPANKKKMTAKQKLDAMDLG